MTKKKSFVKYLRKELENNACYLWGGQGECVLAMKPEVVRNMETSDINAGRVLKHVGDLMMLGKVNKDTHYFDCSGLGVAWFLEHELINHDTTANGLKEMCDPITYDELDKGDMIFKCDDSGKATHVAYMTDGKKKTYIEMVGRDVGIKESKLLSLSGSFVYAGRPRFKWA